MKGGSRSQRGVQLIGGFKFVKGAALTIIAIAMLSTLHKDQVELVTNVAQWLGVDPNGWLFQNFIEKLEKILPKLTLISVGLFVYAAVFTVEGVGLLMRKRWAEYVTVFSTGGLLPLEIYEIVKHATVTRVVVMILNAAIVAYLIWQLRQHEHEDGKEPVSADEQRKFAPST